VLAATLAVDVDPEVVSHNLMSPIPESLTAGNSEKKVDMEDTKSKRVPLRRGLSKRRSL